MSRAILRPRMILALLALVAIVGVGGVWWLVIREPAEELQAQAVIERACTQIEEAGSYDAAVEQHVTVNGVPAHKVDSEVLVDPTFDVYVSGDDYHVIGYAVGEGQTVEYMSVEGTFYFRERGKDWEIWDVPAVTPLDVLGSSPTCPDFTELTAFNVLGEENLDGVMTTHFDNTVSMGPVGRSSELFPDSQISLSYEFWVDATGQLVQFKETRRERYPRVVDGPVNDVVTQQIYRISGVGETNVITPPAGNPPVITTP